MCPELAARASRAVAAFVWTASENSASFGTDVTVPRPVTVMPPVGFEAPPAASGRPTPARATTAAASATTTAIRISFMTCSFRGFEPNTPPGRLRVTIQDVRYQFVDCRWELGSPGRGREPYLAGHVPGASFLDVDEDLAAPPGKQGRHPLPEADTFAAAASRP